jgi:hypothetical protein
LVSRSPPRKVGDGVLAAAGGLDTSDETSAFGTAVPADEGCCGVIGEFKEFRRSAAGLGATIGGGSLFFSLLVVRANLGVEGVAGLTTGDTRDSAFERG